MSEQIAEQVASDAAEQPIEQNTERPAEQLEEQNAEQTTEDFTEDVTGDIAAKAAKRTTHKICRNVLLSILSGAICLLFQIVLFGSYALGVLNAYERSLNPISAIEFILDLFFFQWSRAQQCIIGVAAGVAYIVVLVMLIVNIIISCKTYYALVRGAEAKQKERTIWMLSHSLHSFCLVMIYAVIVNSFTGSDVSVWIIPLMALMVISYTFGRAVVRSKNDMPLSRYIISIVGDVITATLICLMYWLCKESVGDKAFTGLSMLFGGFIGFSFGFKAFAYSFFCNLVEPILNIALIILVLKLASRILREPYRESSQKKCIKAMIYSAVILGAQFIFRVFFTFRSRYLSMDMVREWLLAVRTFNLPIFLLLLAAWLIMKFALPRGDKSQDTFNKA